MGIDTDRFISEIECRPIIWNYKCDEYSNKMVKRKAWEELCTIFIPKFADMDSEGQIQANKDIQRRWKSLRDSFNRELSLRKKEKSGSSSNAVRRQYLYFHQLLFLMPLIEKRPLPADKNKPSDNELSTTGAISGESHLATPTPSPPPPRLPSKKKKKLSEEDRLLQVLANNIEKRTNTLMENGDPDRHFLLSLIPHFKQVPEHAKLDLQIEILNILKSYKSQTPFPEHYHNKHQRNNSNQRHSKPPDQPIHLANEIPPSLPPSFSSFVGNSVKSESPTLLVESSTDSDSSIFEMDEPHSRKTTERERPGRCDFCPRIKDKKGQTTCVICLRSLCAEHRFGICCECKEKRS